MEYNERIIFVGRSCVLYYYKGFNSALFGTELSFVLFFNLLSISSQMQVLNFLIHI